LANEDRSKAEPDEVFIADRSPFSAVYYAKNRGDLLDPLIREQLKEVEAATNIEIHTIHVKVEPEVLWKRIQTRLEAEPERTNYNEDKKSWMLQTLKWYNNFAWDMTVDNSRDSSPRTPLKMFEMDDESSSASDDCDKNQTDGVDMKEVMRAVCTLVSDRSRNFRDIYIRRSSAQAVEQSISPENATKTRPSLAANAEQARKMAGDVDTVFGTPENKSALSGTVLEFRTPSKHQRDHDDLPRMAQLQL